MVGFDRSPVPAKRGGGKKKKAPKKKGRKKEPPPKKRSKPTPSATPSMPPTPTPSYTVDCFGPGARFILPTPATGPGAVGVASIPVTAAAGALSIPLPGVPNVPGLTQQPFTQSLQVDAASYRAVLDNLRQARGFMSASGVLSNQLSNQDQVIECFEDFCKKQGWPI